MRIARVFMVFCVCFSYGAKAELIPLDDFIKHGDYLEVKLSPDGKHLAARLRQDNTVALIFVRREDGKVVGGVKARAKDEVHSVTWVSNERVVYEFAEKRHAFDRPISTGELYAINIDGKRSELIYGYRAGDERAASLLSTKKDSKASQDVLSILEDDKKNILIIEYPWETRGNFWYDSRSRGAIISKLNIYSGRKKKIEFIPHNNVHALADRNGQVNFIRWEEEDNTFKAAYRKRNKEEWRLLSTTFNLDNNLMPIEINSDSSKAFFLGDDVESKVRTLFELNLENGELKQLFKGHRSDIVNWINDPETNTPVIALSYPDRAEYHYSDQGNHVAQIHQKLVGAFVGQDVIFTGSTRDGKSFLVRVEGDVNPGEYYLFEANKNKANYIWANRSWIDPRKMRPTKSFEFDARDGVRVHGYLTLPEQDDDSKLPLVVMVHGGPHGVRDYWAYDSEVQLFVNRGYAVLQVNYRGSGGYGKTFQRMGYREWGGKMIDDIIDATRWAFKNKNLDPKRACIYGASYGGYASLMAVARYPGTYRCAIGYVGVYDLELMYSKGDIPDNWGGEAYLEKVIGRDKGQLRAFSPINHVDKIQSAVMLVHGEEDSRVPVIHAKRMRKELKKAGKDVSWLLYGRSGHGVWDVKSRRELYSGVLEFLRQHVGEK